MAEMDRLRADAGGGVAIQALPGLRRAGDRGARVESSISRRASRRRRYSDQEESEKLIVKVDMVEIGAARFSQHGRVIAEKGLMHPTHWLIYATTTQYITHVNLPLTNAEGPRRRGRRARDELKAVFRQKQRPPQPQSPRMPFAHGQGRAAVGRRACAVFTSMRRSIPCRSTR